MNLPTNLKSRILMATAIGILFPLTGVFASDLREVSPITNRILMLHFDDGHIDYNGKNQNYDSNIVYHHPLDTLAVMNTSSFTIHSPDDLNYSSALNPVHIGKKSKGMDFHRPQWGDPSIVEYILEHWVYLELPFPLKTGKTYILNLGGLAENAVTFTFLYDPSRLRSETIHVNQLGFVPEAVKYAYLSQWMGSFNSDAHPNGGLELDDYAGARFHIVPASNPSLPASLYSGIVVKRKDKTTPESTHEDYAPSYNFSFADVWECNFTAFTTPGDYVLVVENMGASYPFRIGEDVYRDAYYHASRGLFYQRQGVEKEITAELVWPRDHHPDDVYHYYDKDLIDPKHVKRSGNPEAGKPQVFGIWGYYHDAGDWDRVITHDQVTQQLLMLYLLKPDNFGDGDISNRYKLSPDDPDYIEEGSNGIPDLLDEARWLIDFGYRGRHALMDQELGTGGVPGGYMGRDAGAGSIPSWEDDDPSCVSGESSTATFNYAGAAALYGSILKEMGMPSEEYQFWIDDAADAYSWVIANGGGTNDSRVYADVCLYKATGETQYQDDFVSRYTGGGNSYSHPLQWEHSAGIYLMLPEDFPGLNTGFQQGTVRNHVINAANNITNPTADRGFRFGIPEGRPFNLGSHNTPRVEILAIAYEITGDQKYLDCIHTTADYTLGGNETNTTWLTRLGDNPEKFVFHLDSWYSIDYNSKVYTNPIVDGMLSYFGNTEAWVGGGVGSEFWSHQSLSPGGIKTWPKAEGRIQNRNSIAGSEFTVPQSNSQAIFAYGYLAGESDGSFTRNEAPVVSISYPAEGAVFAEGTDVLIQVNTSEDTRKVEYYCEEKFIGSSMVAPFSYIWHDAPSGSYTLTAVAFDEEGLMSSPSEEGEVPVSLSGSINVPVTGVNIENCPSGEVLNGSSYKLTALPEPFDATQKEVTWESSDPAVLKVNSVGEVFVEGYGSATITVTTVDGSFTADCTSDVTPPINVSSVNFTNCSDHDTLGTGQSAILQFDVLPENASDKSVSFLSDDEGIAKVNEFGQITGLSPGTALIIVNTSDGDFRDTCEVTVVEANQPPQVDPVHDTTILINTPVLDILLTGISDNNSAIQELSFNASSERTSIIPHPEVLYNPGADTAIVRIQPLADASGNVIITVTIEDDGGILYGGGNRTDITFMVKIRHSLVLEIPGLIQAEDYTGVVGEVGTGGSEDLDGTDYVGWFGAGEEIHYDLDDAVQAVYNVKARIANGSSGTGLMKLRSGLNLAGEAEIPPTGGWLSWQDVDLQVKMPGGSQTLVIAQGSSVSFNINWIDFEQTNIPCCVEGVSLENCPGTTIYTEETHQLTAKVIPEGVFDATVDWESSDPAVALVDENGLVTPLSEGKTTIKITTHDGGFTDECLINVSFPVGMNNRMDEKIKLFPNPVDEVLSLGFPEDIIRIRITDLSGKVWISCKTSGNPRMDISTEALTNGIYLVRFQSEKDNYYRYFVKN